MRNKHAESIQKYLATDPQQLATTVYYQRHFDAFFSQTYCTW